MLEKKADLLPFRRWLTKGFWAVSDQGLFSISNFALSVLLARWLAPEGYGAFTVAITLFFLLGTFHTALLTEPMLVFGPSRYEGRLSGYLGAVLYGHLGFAVLSCLLLLLVGLGLALSGSSVVSAVLVTLAFTGPFILLVWLMRRACYIRLEPHLATLGGTLYVVLMLTGLYILYRSEWLSAASALGVMALSSLVVSFWLYVRLRVDRSAWLNSKMVREVFNVHWRYGRWAVATGALIWAPGQIYFLLLPLWGGLEASAALKALTNLIMPMLHASTALGILLLPTLVRAREQARFSSLVRFSLVPFVLGPALYWLLLAVLHQPLVIWLYRGQYADYASLLWLLGLLPIAAGVTTVIGASLRALERPDLVFFTYALSTVIALVLGVGAILLWGVVGAVVSLTISYGVTAAIMLAFYRWLATPNFDQRGQGATNAG